MPQCIIRQSYQESGFDVSKADWLKHQAKQTLELSDEELETVSGGRGHGMNFGAMPAMFPPPAMPQGDMNVTFGGKDITAKPEPFITPFWEQK